MRNNRTCTFSVMGALLFLCVALYVMMETWAMTKSQAEGQLASARAEAAKLVSNLEGQLRDASGQQRVLQDKVNELTARVEGKDMELASAKAELTAQAKEAASEKAKLAAKSSEATSAAEAKLSQQRAETSRVRELLTKAEAKLAAKPSKAFTVDVEELSWKDMDRVPVWVWWDFPKGIPTGYRLNVRTWMKYIPADKFDLRLVNFTNIKKYIPDLPDAFYRMYPLAQSDYIRAAMLALHGGVYMDGDMLLRNSLDNVFKEIFDGKTDVMPYLWEHQECRKSFSTNFMAGTRGNLLNREWLGRIYQLMSAKCPGKLGTQDDGMYEFFNHNGCCYLSSGAPRQTCYVSFGMFGDRSAHHVMEQIDRSSSKKRRLRMTCIDKWKGMAANASGSNGELLWKKFLPGPPEGYQGPIGKWSEVPKREQRTEMCWREGQDLRCTQSGRYPVFFERHGYHLFNLNNNDLIGGFKKEEELLDSGTVVAELYKLALEGEQPDPRLGGLGLTPMKVREQDRATNKWWGDTQQFKLSWLRK